MALFLPVVLMHTEMVKSAHAGDMAYLAQASENAKRKDGMGGTWAQDYYLPAKADG